MNRKIIVILIVVFVLAGVLIAGALFSKQSKLADNNLPEINDETVIGNDNNVDNTIGDTEASNTAQQADNHEKYTAMTRVEYLDFSKAYTNFEPEKISDPEDLNAGNSIYLTTKDGLKYIVIKFSEDDIRIIKQNNQKFDVYFSDPSGHPLNFEDYDFQEFDLLYALEEESKLIVINISLESDGIYYLSFSYMPNSNNAKAAQEYFRIVEVDQNKGKYRTLYEGEMHHPNIIEGYFGLPYVDQIIGKYMVSYLAVCYGCDEVSDGQAIITNLESKVSMALGEVGTIEIVGNDLIAKEIISVEMECEVSKYCPDTYEAIGEEHVYNLLELD